MEKLINLPSGLRVKNNNFMLDFRHDGVRYRIVTTYTAISENVTKASKLLASIKLDLEREQFHLSHYKRFLSNPKALQKLDVNYKNSASQVYMLDLIEEQLQYYTKRVKANTLAQSTYEGYVYIINLHLKPFFNNICIDEVNHTMIEQFIKKLPFTRKRVSCIIRPLRPIFKRAKKLNLIKYNPLDDIDNDLCLTNIASSDYEVQPFTLDEIQKILDGCKHHAIKNFIKFGFWTGMRIGEIFALQWSDIDFEKEIIKITKASSVHGIIKQPKTKSGIRDLEMTEQAKEALLQQFQLTGTEYNGRVFKTPVHNHPWTKTDAFRRYWQEALENAEIKYRNPYQMRHTFISYMLSVGNNPLILYSMVGHSNPNIMYNKYARFIQQKGGEKLLKTK